MPKVTMQDIADAVGTSRITVWKAFNHKSGVSETTRLQILRTAADMGYQKLPSDIFEEVSSLHHKTAALIVSRPETSIFWTNIIHEIAKEFSRHDTDLIYTYVPHIYEDGYALPATLHEGGVSGCIMLNVYDRHILRLINRLPIPKVFLDTAADTSLSGLQGDLILLEGKDTLRALTDHVIRHGYSSGTSITPGPTPCAITDFWRPCRKTGSPSIPAAASAPLSEPIPTKNRSRHSWTACPVSPRASSASAIMSPLSHVPAL